jgi:hypothetical protein
MKAILVKIERVTMFEKIFWVGVGQYYRYRHYVHDDYHVHVHDRVRVHAHAHVLQKFRSNN